MKQKFWAAFFLVALILSIFFLFTKKRPKDDLLAIKKGEAAFYKTCVNCHRIDKTKSSLNSIESYLSESQSRDTIHSMFVKFLSDEDIRNIKKYITFKKDYVAIP